MLGGGRRRPRSAGRKSRMGLSAGGKQQLNKEESQAQSLRRCTTVKKKIVMEDGNKAGLVVYGGELRDMY